MSRVADFPDLLPLGGAGGRAGGEATGWFSDHGSWQGARWGKDSLLDCGRPIDLGSPAVERRVWADRLEARLQSGASVRLGFASANALVLDYRHERAPSLQTTLPFRAFPAGAGRWLVTVRLDSGEPKPADPFTANRARWDALFERAFRRLRFPDSRRCRLLLARAVTTLSWNRRAALPSLPHQGVIPSPFAYRGYWGWDSWKQARALAWLDPALAAEQLRAQFCRQREDGMVADTVMLDPAADNWRNSKPPLAAQALLEIWRATGDPSVVAELAPRCLRFLQWWAANRRLPGESLFRCGGTDRETAMWDSGWDDCLRFDDVPLVDGPGGWKLFDLWQPDLNGYLAREHQALKKLLGRAAKDLRPGGMATLWNPATHFHHDLRPSTGAPTSVLSLAGLVPLWDGAVSEATRSALLDPALFATPFPFPVIAANHPRFDPDGYWNGAVWLDHAFPAARLLGGAGRELVDRLLDGIAAQPSFYECYSPLTGQPCAGGRPAVPQFSWSAAASLEFLTNSGADSARSIS